MKIHNMNDNYVHDKSCMILFGLFYTKFISDFDIILIIYVYNIF